DLYLYAASTLTTGQIGMFTGATITVYGATPNFSGLTSLNGDNVYAYGGATVAFPNVTSYSGVTNDTHLEANGTSGANGTGTPARLDLSHVRTLTDASSFGHVYVNAANSGQVNLSGLTSNPGGTVVL